MKEEGVPLSTLKEGDAAYVHALTGGNAFVSRLASMGIAQATRLKVFRHGGGGPIIVQVGDGRVALGTGEADKILVHVIPGPPEEPPPDKEESRRLLVALAGQPNIGKSTIFNILTGLSQHVGNWPGKTVEKKEGIHHSGEVEMRIVDLPGTYSLTACSEEEKVARDFIIHESPDVIVLLVNAAALERSLYLLTEVLLLGPPVVIALNMLDVAEDQGISIDTKALQDSLGIPVVPMVAVKNRGVRELVTKVIALQKGEVPYHPSIPGVSRDHRAIYREIADLVSKHFPESLPANTCGYNAQWVAIKLMEGDPEITRLVEAEIPTDIRSRIQTLLIQHEDALHAVVGGRYDWIEEVTRAAISRFRMGEVVLTDRIDHILTRPVFGIPILLGAFGLIFGATYLIGFPLQKLLEELFSSAAQSLGAWMGGAHPWLKGILIEGVFGGVGSVLTFVPILLIFFLFLAVLEDVGYMARAAFVMDRFMHLIGLHGKSFIPLCLGFGCNVPAVLGARIIESRKERLLTMFLSPFVPCTARLAVLTFVSAAVFGTRAALVAWSVLTVNILLLGIVGMTASRFFLKGEPMPFIMELPLYHKPNLRTIFAVVWFRMAAFIRKAGTIILAVSVAVWILSNWPGATVEESALAWIGRLLEPLGSPLGLDWKLIVALLTSIVAKENAIATLGVLYGVGDAGLVNVLPQVLAPASALAFLVVLMLFVPCAATLAVLRREMDSGRWFSASFAAMLVLSIVAGIASFHLARVLGL